MHVAMLLTYVLPHIIRLTTSKINLLNGDSGAQALDGRALSYSYSALSSTKS